MCRAKKSVSIEVGDKYNDRAANSSHAVRKTTEDDEVCAAYVSVKLKQYFIWMVYVSLTHAVSCMYNKRVL